MPAAVSVRRDFSAGELRRLAGATRNANQSRRLLSLAAVLDGMNRAQAARIGGMDRQTLRDWVHRFNAHGPDGLKDSWSKGNPPRLSADQQAELAQLVETGPDRVVPLRAVQGCRRPQLPSFASACRDEAVHECTNARDLLQSEKQPTRPAYVQGSCAGSGGSFRA